jgi:hypothetical protein
MPPLQRLEDNYIKLFHKHAKRSNLFKKVKEFYKRRNHMSTYQIRNEYKSLDAIRCAAASFVKKDAAN